MHIVTLNTRGLGSQLKRRHLFQSLNKYSISCLQETFITNDTCNLWSNEWNGEFFYECGTAHSKGLIILVNKNFKVSNLKKIQINDRCLAISFTLLDKEYFIFNIYAPADKEERIPFFANLPNVLKLNELPPDAYTLICSDFNSVANNDLDILTGAPHSKREIASFNNFTNKYNLTDCWRKINPKVKDFSWIRYNSKAKDENDEPTTTCIARRLDYIFCNSNLKNFLKSSTMSHFSSSDHKIVCAYFQVDTYLRGPGRWQMNESLLDCDSFIEHMSFFISEYNKELNMNPLFDKRLSWDLLKIGIRDECSSYSRNKRLNSKLGDFNMDIKRLNEELTYDPNSAYLLDLLRKKTLQKEIYEISESKGALKRSRALHISDSERSTQYFLGIERSRQENMIIRSIYNTNNELIETPALVLKNISVFYQDLLNGDIANSNNDSINNLETFMENIDHPTLNNEEMESLEAPLNMNELKTALYQLNRDSAPGIDGLTPAFYIHFWDVLKEPLFNCFNESIVHKALSLSQRRAILTLLPKGTNCDLNNLGFWRPLSLTCTDYKLYSKVLAMRLQTVIKKLIHVNQVGYIPGRSISDHIRIIDDIINFSATNNIPGILTSLDFKKAFDTVSKSSIIATMKKFGFGPNFLKYVETILSDTEASVKNGGWFSHWFKTTRGVRQGCVLSPLLFIMVVECLAIKIRADVQIVSLLNRSEPYLNEDESIKMVQYADDLSLFLKNQESLTKALIVIDDFKLLTGLTLNRNKSIAMCLGGLVLNEEKSEGLTWLEPDKNMKILGIFFNSKKEASCIKENWESKIEEITKLITSWNRRNVSLLGKSLVAKTFLLSKINHIIQSLALPDKVLDIIDNLIFKFLWMKTDLGKRATERVKRNTLCLPVEQGGIHMISVKDQQKVMLLRWLHKGCRAHFNTHFTIINHFFKNIGGIEYILSCTANSTLFKGLPNIKSIFWQKALQAWINLDKSVYKMDLNKIPLFNNSLFLYKGFPLLIKKWIHNDLLFYHQMIDDNNQIKSFRELCNVIRPYGGLFLDYLAVKNAIMQYNRSHDVRAVCNDPRAEMSSVFKMNNSSLRELFVKQSQPDSILNCVGFWERKLNLNIIPYFTIAHKTTLETKLRLLHFKLVHNIYPNNVLLHKMKIKNYITCDYCRETDFVDHMFVTCSRLQTFWDLIKTLLEFICVEEISISITNALFGFLRSSLNCSNHKLREANNLILLAKFCIIKSKYSTQNLENILYFEIALRNKQFPTLQPLI